ncbi:MAG TPA: hypothetical protein VHZ29_08035 [Rhizomicrobium sp.]|nr:hypothetical protein [Rhizomicrobium sp.]
MDASTLGASDVLTFNGSSETNGSYNIVAGAGNDVLTGGSGKDHFDLSAGGTDTVTGGGGADTITAGGSDTFVYSAVSNSTSVNFDQISALDFGNDAFRVSSIAAVTGVDAEVHGSLSTATFDANLASAPDRWRPTTRFSCRRTAERWPDTCSW